MSKFCANCDTELSNPHGNKKYCKICVERRHKNNRVEYTNTLRGHLNRLVNKKGTRRYNRDDVTIEQLEVLYQSQKGLCALSGVPLTHYHTEGKKGNMDKQCLTNISLDRIDNNRGYEPDNIQLVTYVTNVMKSTLSENELIWWCKQILQNKGVR